VGEVVLVAGDDPLDPRTALHGLDPSSLTARVDPTVEQAQVVRGDLPAKVVFHSDRGTQGASAQITAFATAHGLTRSMGYTGICWDNAMAESFFATLKTEFYYRRVWPTKKAARIEVGKWIEDRYNRRRRHASIGQITPVAFELQYSRQIADSQKAA
jgi:putative transposase